MEQRNLQSFRKALLARRAEVEQEASRMAQEGRSVQATSPDPGDRANDTYTKEFTFSLSSSQSALLQTIDGALGRIDHGGFGQCLSCGQDIGLKRLEAVPWTHYCIDCQTRMEAESDQIRQTGT